MKNGEKIDEILKKIRGHVLSETILIEIDIINEIEEYFFKKKDQKSSLFRKKILKSKRFSFDDKIELFRFILETKKSKYKDIIFKDLRKIQELRNLVAHGDLIYSKSNQKKIVIKKLSDKKPSEITSNTITEFNERVYNFHKIICRNKHISPEDFDDILG